MSHHGKIEEIIQANNLGYKTYLYFVCTDHFEKNILRVKMRVDKGGHFVSKDKIKDRYFKTLENLSDVIKNVHRAFIFDNSHSKNELIAEVYKGNAFKFHSATIPAWFEEYVYNKFEF